jgi:hypothetical protein
VGISEKLASEAPSHESSRRPWEVEQLFADNDIAQVIEARVYLCIFRRTTRSYLVLLPSARIEFSIYFYHRNIRRFRWHFVDNKKRLLLRRRKVSATAQKEETWQRVMAGWNAV